MCQYHYSLNFGRSINTDINEKIPQIFRSSYGPGCGDIFGMWSCHLTLLSRRSLKLLSVALWSHKFNSRPFKAAGLNWLKFLIDKLKSYFFPLLNSNVKWLFLRETFREQSLSFRNKCCSYPQFDFFNVLFNKQPIV